MLLTMIWNHLYQVKTVPATFVICPRDIYTRYFCRRDICPTSMNTAIDGPLLSNIIMFVGLSSTGNNWQLSKQHLAWQILSRNSWTFFSRPKTPLFKIVSRKQYCYNPYDNLTKHNLNTVVGLDTKMTVQTQPYPTENQWWPPGDSDQHLLTTTKYNLINNNRQVHNNDINNHKNNKLGLSWAKLSSSWD